MTDAIWNGGLLDLVLARNGRSKEQNLCITKLALTAHMYELMDTKDISVGVIED